MTKVHDVENAAAGAQHRNVSGAGEGANGVLDALCGNDVQAVVEVAARERAVYVKERDNGRLVLLGHLSSFVGGVSVESIAYRRASPPLL